MRLVNTFGGNLSVEDPWTGRTGLAAVLVTKLGSNHFVPNGGDARTVVRTLAGTRDGTVSFRQVGWTGARGRA